MARSGDDAMVASQREAWSGSSCSPQQEANIVWAEMLDRILNDPDEPLDAGKVWWILDELTNNTWGETGQPDT